MKKLTAIALLLIFITNYCYTQSGWFWQNPLPQGNDLFSGQYINLNLMYAVGDAGTFIKSTNGGLNWTITHSLGGFTGNYAKPLYTLKFLNELTGFIATGYPANTNGILRTTDEGNTWNSVTTDTFPSFKSIFFINANTGWSCCSYGGFDNNNIILKTTDGGLNWFVHNTTLKAIYSIFFINPDTGWFVGRYVYPTPPYDGSFYIYKTTNGGLSFTTQLQLPMSQTLKTVFFVNENTGWAGGTKLWKTTDSGNSWSSQDFDVSSIAFVNGQTGFFAGNSGIFKTTNNGTNWILQSTASCNSISVLYDDNALVVGNNGTIVKTMNQGNNWIWLSQSLTSNRIESIFFANENTGFCISSNSILKTTDKGLHWYFTFENASSHLNDIYFINELTGWVPGYNGLIYKTTNSGINWSIQNSNTTVVLYHLSFINQNTGWILGESCILKTNNGGINWNKINIVEGFLNNMMYAIQLLNSDTGIIAGVGGIGRTTNGGLSWQRTFDNSMQDLGKDSQNNLYAITLMDFYKSTNLGMNWQLLSSPWKASMDLKMVNSSTGYMACMFGNLLRTTNGGLTWDTWKLFTNGNLRAVFAIDTNKCWVVGERGYILSTLGSGIITNLNYQNTTMPELFLLSQNYPNPFNPQTKIKFDVPANVKGKTSNVKLVIYDLLGREVVTLVNEELKPGTYEVDWDASNFSSGVYFYRIISGNYIETKKMILMK